MPDGLLVSVNSISVGNAWNVESSIRKSQGMVAICMVERLMKCRIKQLGQAVAFGLRFELSKATVTVMDFVP